MSDKKYKLSGDDLEQMYKNGKELCNCMTMGELVGKAHHIASAEFWMITGGYVPVDEELRTKETDYGASVKKEMKKCTVYRCRTCGETFEGPWEIKNSRTEFKDD